MTEELQAAHDWQVTDNQGHAEECAHGCGATWYLFNGIERHPGPCPAAGPCNFCDRPGFRVGFGSDRVCPDCARAATIDGDQISASLSVDGRDVPPITLTSEDPGHDARRFLTSVVAGITAR